MKQNDGVGDGASFLTECVREMARPPGTDEREIRRGAWRREQIDAAAVGGIGAALVSPLVNLGGETTALPLAIVMVAVAQWRWAHT